MFSIKPTKSKAPKAVISMKDLNAVFQPEKISHAHGLQISYLQDERMRNLFVYHDNGQVNSSAVLHSFLTDELDLVKRAHKTCRTDTKSVWPLTSLTLAVRWKCLRCKFNKLQNFSYELDFCLSSSVAHLRYVFAWMQLIFL